MRSNYIILLSLIGIASHSFALTEPGTELANASISTILGNSVDLSLPFQDESGKVAPLKTFVTASRPIIIVPAYYGCPRLCGLVLSAVTKTIKELGLTPGVDYTVLTASFDTTDTAESASKKAQEYKEKAGIPPDSAGWKFLVGEESSVKNLMNQIGFHYLKDNGEFAHSAAIMLLTSDGTISQYFTGVEFPAQDVKLGLIEASEGRIGTALDHILLYCFHFDVTKGRYTLAVLNVMKVVGAVSILALSSLIFILRSRFA